MNILKIFEALEKDEMNSALGIIVQELEAQGYSVELMDIPIKSSELYDGKYEDLERLLEPIKISLFRKGNICYTYSLKFIEYHKPVFEEI